MSQTAAAAAQRAPLEQRVWQAMRVLVVERNDQRREVAEALGMSFLRAKALRHLLDGAHSMSELAATLATDAPYTTVLIDELEQRGFVTRAQHPTDRRMKVVSLTAQGAKAARRANKILARPPVGLATLSEAELTALDTMLARILDV